jgi:hypothetical protein
MPAQQLGEKHNFKASTRRGQLASPDSFSTQATNISNFHMADK